MTAPTASVQAAIRAWDDACSVQNLHKKQCRICSPTMAHCLTGQQLAEEERAAWAAVRQAREEVAR